MDNDAQAGGWIGAQAERWLRLGRRTAAADANRRALAAAPHDFGLHAQRIRILVRLQDLGGARAAFDGAGGLVRSAADLDQLFRLVPTLFEGWPRTSRWLELQARLAQIEGEERVGLAGAALALRLQLALRDHDGFLDRLERAPSGPGDPAPGELRRIGDVLRSARFPDFDRPKVFGIGLSKTGTTSLTQALGLLGLHAAHFTNPLTHEVLKVEDAFFFDALVDTPVCAVFETLYHMFPRSKFIYTTREPVAWQASFTEHYRRQHHQTPAFEHLADKLSTRGATARGQERAAIHASLYGGRADPLSARLAFEGRVRSFFSANDADRLLWMDICGGESWDKLCPFLDRQAPPQDFPWENRTASALPPRRRVPFETPTPQDRPSEPWTMVEQANACLARRELAQAEALLLDCRAEFAAYGPAAAGLAHVLRLQGREEASAAAWRAVVRDYSGALQPWWLVELARAERRAGDPDEAERLLRGCLDRFPDHASAAAALAELLTSLDRWAEAEAAWRRALEDFPSAAQPWWFQSAAAAQRALGRDDHAEALLDVMEARFPAARETLARRARAAAGEEDWAQALERWDACLAAEADEPAPETLSSRALAIFRLGRVQEALDSWNDLAARAADFVPAHLAHAAAAAELGRWDEVRRLYTLLIDHHPQAAPAEWWVERLRARLQDRRQGVQPADIDDLLARFPQSPQAHMLRVEFCFARSLGARAIAAALQAGLRQVPTSRWLLAEQVRMLLPRGGSTRRAPWRPSSRPRAMTIMQPSRTGGWWRTTRAPPRSPRWLRRLSSGNGRSSPASSWPTSCSVSSRPAPTRWRAGCRRISSGAFRAGPGSPACAHAPSSPCAGTRRPPRSSPTFPTSA